MSTYYKKHELSLSLNGDTIMHIARNASGVVVFRETSEKALKGAIDDSIKEQYQRNELVAQKKAEKEKKKQEPEVQVIQDINGNALFDNFFDSQLQEIMSALLLL